MKIKRTNLIYFFIFFFLAGCQLNEALVVLKESLPVDLRKKESNDKDSLSKKNEIKNEKKIVTKKKFENENKVSRNTETLSEKIEIEESKINENLFALVQPRIEEERLKNFQDKKDLKKIGLLIPVSGKRSFAGQYVINSLRLSLSESSLDFQFKVLDTKSTKLGLSEAFSTGIKNGIKVFVGPIFSDSTHYLKSLTIKKDIIIFSLSSDQEAFSDNIVITGTSLDEEFRCIFDKIDSQNLQKIAILQTENKFTEKYSKVIKKYSAKKDIDFFSIKNNEDLEQKIKMISRYESRRLALKEKIKEIDDMATDEETKKSIKKEFERLETFGPTPYEAIIVSAMGTKLVEIISLLAYFDINTDNSFIIGTTGWDSLGEKKENVFNESFYVSNKNKQSKIYDEKYESVFSDTPNKINYITHDLFIILENLAKSQPNLDLEKISFEGTLGKTFFTRTFISREILFKKFYNGKSIVQNTCK